jgi:hypothetical protein
LAFSRQGQYSRLCILEARHLRRGGLRVRFPDQVYQGEFAMPANACIFGRLFRKT